MITPMRRDGRPLTGIVKDVVEEDGGDSEIVFEREEADEGEGASLEDLTMMLTLTSFLH